MCCLRIVAVAFAVLITPTSTSEALAQDKVKIGVILPLSGQFADAATQIDNGIKHYIQQNGATVAGKQIEIIRRDTGGIAPDLAKRLAQELIVRDNVDILAGFGLTPNTMSAADVSQQAKKFMVVMNAATAAITTKSDYMVRTSLTTPQLNGSLGTWAAKRGARKVYSMVSDFGPGLDAENAFLGAFRAAGGEIIGQAKFPVATIDFGPFVQRAKDSNSEAIYIWVPGGAQPAAIAKALAERGINAAGNTKVFGQLELTDPSARRSMGDAAIGIIVASHYDAAHESAKNKSFVATFNAAFKRDPDFFAVGGWDGMHLIYEALKKTGGKTDGESLVGAAKGMSWESPRGQITIDPQTRDINQTVYIRRTEKVGGQLVNVEIDRIPDVKGR